MSPRPAAARRKMWVIIGAVCLSSLLSSTGCWCAGVYIWTWPHRGWEGLVRFLVLQAEHKLLELFTFNWRISGFSYHRYNKRLFQNHPLLRLRDICLISILNIFMDTFYPPVLAQAMFISLDNSYFTGCSIGGLVGSPNSQADLWAS